MNQHKTIDESGSDVLDPERALTEQTLAVDLARVEIDQQIATAHKFPRSIDTVVKKIGTLACYNKDAAENCIYALPRGGKPIIGPSIGFASIVQQSWGNCRVAANILGIDRKERVVIAAGRFFDLETNAETIVPVNRRIVDKNGRIYNDDMIQVTAQAAASIAARNAILRGVSRGIWFPIWQDALAIVRGTVETFSENREKALRAMAQFGVKPEQIYMALGLKGEIELTFEHIPMIRGMYVQLRDGSISVEEMFDPRRMTGRGFETVANPLGDEEDGGIDEPPAAAEPAAQPPQSQADAPDDDEPPPPQKPRRSSPAAKKGRGVAGTAPKGKNAQAGRAGPARAMPGKAAPPETAAATPKATHEPRQEPPKPVSAEQYVANWLAFCADAVARKAPVTEIRQQWGAERDLRTSCMVTGAHFDKAKAAKDEAEAWVLAATGEAR